MLTYQHIIGKLTESQKLRLLTDLTALADPEFISLGIPKTVYAQLDNTDTDIFPSPTVLARSFDPALVRSVSSELCREAAAQGITTVATPAPYNMPEDRHMLSEDPYLSAVMSNAYLAGAADAGLSSCISLPNFMHGEPSTRLRGERFDEPFTTAIAESGCVAAVAGKYALRPKTDMPFVLRKRTDAAETVSAIKNREICIEGSAPALQKALFTYNQLQSSLEHGTISATDLDGALASNDVISPEIIDEAVDRVIAFATACSKQAKQPKDLPNRNKLDRSVFASATVLLKNDSKLLPLTAGTKLCVIGGLEDEKVAELNSAFSSIGCNYLGYERGYDRDCERSDKFIPNAYRLALDADVVLILLDVEDNAIRLSPNRLAICDQIGRLNKKTILAISSERAIDLAFTNILHCPPQSVMLLPLTENIKFSYLADMLGGRLAPEGRLPETCIDRKTSDAQRNGLLTGPFIGYRYYDSAGAGSVYPFGHGLSYTSFRYSELQLTSASVSFAVTNMGDRPGSEFPQVYIGHPGSPILRPKKELIGFERITLDAGQTKIVTLPLHPLSVFRDDGNSAHESGEYTVYVGASVSDIRLSGQVFFNGDNPTPDGCELCDYLPSATNIFKDNYTLEVKYIPMKASLRTLLIGISAAALAIGVKIYDLVTVSNSIFLNIVAAILALGAIVCFALEAFDRKKANRKKVQELEAAKNDAFENADRISMPSAEELFLDSKVQAEQVSADEQLEKSAENDYFADVDKSLTFSIASDELVKLAAKKGVALDRATATEIFAAFATSRLVLLRGMNGKAFAALASLLGGYFGCNCDIDQVNGNYQTEADLLFDRNAPDPAHSIKHALTAIKGASENNHNIHIVFLNNVSPAGLQSYFTRYAMYAHAPFNSNTVIVTDSQGNNLPVRIPQNVWFVLNLDPKESLDKLPAYISEISTVNNWSIELTSSTSSNVSCRPFYYGQMLYLAEKLHASFAPNEEMWKKIDRVEHYAAEFCEYTIGNKLWRGMEAYLSVLLDTGCDEAPALDKTLAVKLIPSLIHALSGKLGRDSRGLGETLDEAFGEDYTAICRKVIKDSGANLI